MIAETVVVDNSERSLISTREMGPCRRIVSSTLKRFIARINSGSAVFHGLEDARVLMAGLAGSCTYLAGIRIK
ncbi:hypothetical protein [Sinorhizobium psoraleae]|uniref:Transposase n=1 Tax=Sinorhizobium psoraleae TaxID=520838 RepID=A0ABT4KPG7_9HYPH|nr:hypothetical protein [Sinorhizobium psoraleae]MCZ4093875.1 hypothetical protein [Sinorhizobium psoraleae]